VSARARLGKVAGESRRRHGGGIMQTTLRFEVIRNRIDEFTWQLLEGDHLIAESFDSFPTRAACLAAIEKVRRAHHAYVLDLARYDDRLRERIRVSH
jgi:uncharacterized protein YegP (UPF0339 family)